MIYEFPNTNKMGTGSYQGLRASSQLFTSPLEFNATFRDRTTLRLELNGGSKIRDPVPAKFKHVTKIVTCTLLCCNYVTYVPALWNFQKADFIHHPVGKKCSTFSSFRHESLASNICLRYALTCSLFSFTHRLNAVVLSHFRCVHPENQTKIFRI